MCSRRLNLVLLLAIFFCIAYLNIHEIYCETYKEFITSTLPELCPYSTFCTVGPYKNFRSKKSSPCCKPCSCDNLCLVTGNCCPDFTAVIDSTSLQIAPRATCSIPFHYEYDDFDRNWALNSGRYQSYYIISTCPEEFSDQDVIRKCIQPDTLRLVDRAMVSDGRGRAFSNRFCAECNNVQEFTTWDLNLVCRHFSNQLTDVNTIQHLNESLCLALSSPPTKAIASAARCYPVEYDKCNVTGKWETYNALVERACRSTTLPFVKAEFGAASVYANPYCFLCNERLGAVLVGQCPLDDGEDARHDGIGVPFTAMLNLGSNRPRESSDVTKRMCDPSQIYDSHFGKCRQLHCPLSLLPFNGECVQVFKETAGLPIFTQIDISYANEKTRDIFKTALQDTKTHNKKLYADIATHFAVDIGLPGHSCGLCPSRAFIRDNQTGSVLELGFVTNARCPPSVVIDLLHRWNGWSKSVWVNRTSLHLVFDVRMTYTIDVRRMDVMPTETFPTVVLIWLHEKICAGPFVFLQPKFHCPHLDLPWSDYMEVISTNGRRPRPSDFVVVDNRKNVGNQSDYSYRICLDRYFEQMNKGVDVQQHWIVACAAMVVVVILL